MSSKVWLSGEYWNVPMAYFHELGHTNYLHHAMKGGCAYCDLTCPMVRLCVCVWGGGGLYRVGGGGGLHRGHVLRRASRVVRGLSMESQECGGGVWSPRRGEGEERPQLFPV